MKNIIAFISFFLFVSLHAQDLDYPDSLPINKIQNLGSHNSYRKSPYKRIVKWMKILNPFYLKGQAPVNHWEYAHLPLDSQFQHYGIRSIELDIYNDPNGGKFYKRQANALCLASTKSHEPSLLWPGMKILHIADVDYNTHYFTLNQALHAIKRWSLAHPTHYPIMVMLETKNDGVGDHIKLAGFKKAIKFDFKAFMDIKDEIEVVFTDKSHILRPDDVRGSFNTIREAVTQSGFPKLGDCRGKIIFILMGGQSAADMLAEKFPSSVTLPFFTFTACDRNEAAFVKLDDPKQNFEEIKAAVKQGFIVRVRADADTKEAQFNDYSSFEKAKESGAQMISTDFYKPFKKTGYVLKREMLLK
jgi:hypothetical protein